MNAATTATAEPSAAARRPNNRNAASTSAAPPAPGSTHWYRASSTSFSGGSGGIARVPIALLLRRHFEAQLDLVVDLALAEVHAPHRPIDRERRGDREGVAGRGDG